MHGYMQTAEERFTRDNDKPVCNGFLAEAGLSPDQKRDLTLRIIMFYKLSLSLEAYVCGAQGLVEGQ
jgi:hypothetical protein